MKPRDPAACLSCKKNPHTCPNFRCEQCCALLCGRHDIKHRKTKKRKS